MANRDDARCHASAGGFARGHAGCAPEKRTGNPEPLRSEPASRYFQRAPGRNGVTISRSQLPADTLRTGRIAIFIISALAARPSEDSTKKRGPLRIAHDPVTRR